MFDVTAETSFLFDKCKWLWYDAFPNLKVSSNQLICWHSRVNIRQEQTLSSCFEQMGHQLNVVITVLYSYTVLKFPLDRLENGPKRVYVLSLIFFERTTWTKDDSLGFTFVTTPSSNFRIYGNPLLFVIVVALDVVTPWIVIYMVVTDGYELAGSVGALLPTLADSNLVQASHGLLYI